jgi:hypothetical protein
LRAYRWEFERETGERNARPFCFSREWGNFFAEQMERKNGKANVPGSGWNRHRIKIFGGSGRKKTAARLRNLSRLSGIERA